MILTLTYLKPLNPIYYGRTIELPRYYCCGTFYFFNWRLVVLACAVWKSLDERKWFILGLIAAINLAMFMGPENDPTMGAMWGFLAGAGWVATFVGTHYLFERKSFKLFLINAGYSVVALTIMGVIIAAWQ